MHLLVIDDDAAFSRLLQKEFERHGDRASIALDGASGLARIAEGSIDAIVLDHNFPGHDGLSVLAAIRQLPDAPPVVYLTASHEASVAVAALKAGASDFVVKDVQGEFLVLLKLAIDGALASAALRKSKEIAEAEVRAARDRFKALAEERAMLMREVNHRVGNSLALIAALLRLQGSSTEAAGTRAALGEAEGRIAAVARVHRHLYTSDDVKAVALDEYLAALTEDLRDAAAGVGESLSLDAEPIEIEPDRAVALGVLLTELVINARKHAYPNGSGRSASGCARATAAKWNSAWRMTASVRGSARRHRAGVSAPPSFRPCRKSWAARWPTTPHTMERGPCCRSIAPRMAGWDGARLNSCRVSIAAVVVSRGAQRAIDGIAADAEPSRRFTDVAA